MSGTFDRLPARAARRPVVTPGTRQPVWGVGPASAVLALQRSIGNRAVASLLEGGLAASTLQRGKAEMKMSDLRFKEHMATDAEGRPEGSHPGAWFDRGRFRARRWLVKGTEGSTFAGSSKASREIDAIKEVFAARMFRALAGKDFTAKYRIVRGKSPEKLALGEEEVWVGSRRLPHFTPWRDAARVETATRPVPGLATCLVAALLIGETDWNKGNFGISKTDGRRNFARIDFGFSWDFKELEVSLLTTKQGLVQATKDQVPAEFVDEAELARAIARIVDVLPEELDRVGEPFEAALEPYRDGGEAPSLGEHGDFLKMLKGRIAELRKLSTAGTPASGPSKNPNAN